MMNFSQPLLSWYRKNRRDLPWRRTKDPYLIWLSEIIMQQTRIGQGLPYYERFTAAYPSVGLLASAGEQEVLRLWQGLGYYSRARNLLAAARQVMTLHGGRFPSTLEDIRALKGVGEYTAAAIASISFGIPSPVVDGNVVRFITRLYGITVPADLASVKRRIRELAAENIDPRHPGDFNQAMMEFGALVCTPAGPGCDACIFRRDCAALKGGMVESIPAWSPKTPARQVIMHYLVCTCEDREGTWLYLNRREGEGIWKNLYDFPPVNGKEGAGPDRPFAEEEIRKEFPLGDASFLGATGPVIHLLTHRRLHIRFYRFHSTVKLNLPGIAVAVKDLDKYPVPRVIEKYLSEQLF
jgi:A/G-specific adenine glycosylase